MSDFLQTARPMTTYDRRRIGATDNGHYCDTFAIAALPLYRLFVGRLPAKLFICRPGRPARR